MNTFLVDANFFIQAHRAYYPLDVVPSFWRKVKELAHKSVIISIDKVRNEIYSSEDDLKHWCKGNLPDDFFKGSHSIIGDYQTVISWAKTMDHHYQPRAISEFFAADEADAWLVGYALAHNTPIVTYEISQPNRKNKIKIPEACDAVGVPYLNTIEMLRQLNESI